MSTSDLEYIQEQLQTLIELQQKKNVSKITAVAILKILKEEIQEYRIAVPNENCSYTLGEAGRYRDHILKLIDIGINETLN